MPAKLKSVRRFDAKAETDIVCSECRRTIHAGNKVIFLVNWEEQYSFPSGQTFVAGRSYEEAVTTVRVVQDPMPRLIIKTETVASRDGRECVLTNSPVMTFHHPNCGVDDRPIRQLPGSFGMGKRR